MKLKFSVIKVGLSLSLGLAFLSGVLFLIKNTLADQMMFSLVMILLVTFVYWFFFLKCPNCGVRLFSEKPCDNCGMDFMN